MSGIEEPDTPPELPEEYAATYRDAYLRALAENPVVVVEDVDEPVPAYEKHAEAVADPGGWSSRTWLALLVLAVLLIVAAFVVGKLVSDDGPAPARSSARPSADPSSGSLGAPTTTPTSVTRSSVLAPGRRGGAGPAWDGAVRPVTVSSATASCTAPPGVDSANRPVDYEAANAIDSDTSTAWRCDGRGLHQTITLLLPEGTEVGEVGLVPGYAKTDPVSGVDRYAENNRITRVRWILADGVEIEQRLDPDPGSRALQTIRVPRTATGAITLEILRVARGARNTTAISSIEVAAVVA